MCSVSFFCVGVKIGGKKQREHPSPTKKKKGASEKIYTEILEEVSNSHFGELGIAQIQQDGKKKCS